jgi:hypothetical protein
MAITIQLVINPRFSIFYIESDLAREPGCHHSPRFDQFPLSSPGFSLLNLTRHLGIFNN